VLVLDGSCARIGDHATLLALSPLYRDLVGHWQADHGSQPCASADRGSRAHS
jgi:ATP-binding cassette subfamily C protein